MMVATVVLEESREAEFEHDVARLSEQSGGLTLGRGDAWTLTAAIGRNRARHCDLILTTSRWTAFYRKANHKRGDWRISAHRAVILTCRAFWWFALSLRSAPFGGKTRMCREKIAGD